MHLRNLAQWLQSEGKDANAMIAVRMERSGEQPRSGGVEKPDIKRDGYMRDHPDPADARQKEQQPEPARGLVDESQEDSHAHRHMGNSPVPHSVRPSFRTFVISGTDSLVRLVSVVHRQCPRLVPSAAFIK